MLVRTVRAEALRVGHCRHPECVAARGGRLAPARFPATAVLVRHPTAGVILFDTGYAPRFADVTRSFPERLYRWTTPVALPAEEQLVVQLRSRGIAPEDVGRVVLSHLHADHVSGLRDLPRARVVVHGEALADSLGRGRWGAVRRGFLGALLPADLEARLERAERRPAVELGRRLAPFERGLDLLGDGSLVAVPLPGHARGQLGLLLRDERRGDVLLAADACWSLPALDEGRLPSALAGLVTADRRAYRATFQALGALRRRRPELWLLPSHCPTALAAFRAEEGEREVARVA